MSTHARLRGSPDRGHAPGLPPGRKDPRRQARRDALLRRLRGGTLREREGRFGLALVTPTMLLVLVVVAFPVLWTVLLAFQRIRLIDLQDVFSIDLTGRNFAIVFQARGFWQTLWTTFTFTLAVTALTVAVGLVAALALRRPFRGRGLVRALVLVPYVMPVVSAAVVWRIGLNSQFGPVNEFGARFLGWDEAVAFVSQGNHTVELLGARFTVPITFLVLVGFEVWRSFPLAYLFLLARLQAVSASLEEAAVVDGATILQRFRHILLPQLSGVIAVLLFLRFIWTFQTFEGVFLLTRGAGGTEVISIQLYNYLTARNDVGAAAALGLVLSVLLGVVFFVYYRWSVSRETREETG